MNKGLGFMLGLGMGKGGLCCDWYDVSWKLYYLGTNMNSKILLEP